jgi:tRNA 2-selenouridine synthase
MQATQIVSDYQQIIATQRPLIDVRAPLEYQGATLPGAVNLPLMDDDERHKVGICYKKKGREAALELGHELVNGAIKKKRIQAWADFIAAHPDALLFCSRGGLRSQISQQWINDQTGLSVPRIDGGYKAFRRYLLEQLEPGKLTSMPIILNGRTGAGKTILLQHLDNAIDLEKIANHRGSSFGNFIDPQPGQANFENLLAFALVKHASEGHSTMVLEAEGTHVGRCYLPGPLAAHFNTCPLVLLEASLAQRVQITFDEYVVKEQADYRQAFGEENGLVRWLESMQHKVDKISRRLGGQRVAVVKQLQLEAHNKQLEEGRPDGHKMWIEKLLGDYYDPMYDYKIKKKAPLLLFSGDYDAVLSFLQEYKGA